MPKNPTQGGRSRNQNGMLRKKRSDADLRTLREVYGDDIASGPGNKHLGTVLKDEGVSSLTELLERNGDPK